MPADQPAAPAAHAESRAAGPRWLLFVHQLPSSPSNLRVRTWRRLQQIGALPLRQSVYVLPDSPSAREDFEWLKAEVEGAGGQATVFRADDVDAWSRDTIVEEFRRTRQADYAELASEAERTLKRLASTRRATVARAHRTVQQIRQRLAAIERIDFFGSAGRDRIVALIRTIEERTRPQRGTGKTTAAERSTSYRGRLWVTRPRPGVDRMSSAWLIRRFIDATARFGFAADRDAAPQDSIPFDMFGVEFTHRGDACTFEVLRETFGLEEPALASIAAIVHDLDLKDGRHTPPQAPTVDALVEGLRLLHSDDQALLADGMTLFEALYRSLDLTERTRGPSPVAKRKART